MTKDKTWRVDKKAVKELAPSGKPGNVTSPVSHGAGAKPAARILDKQSCPEPAPHRPLFLLATQCTLYADGLPLARLSDPALDLGAPDLVVEGAATFTVCGLPAARKDDGMGHGGVVLEGSAQLMIGGPKFALPPNLVIDGSLAFKLKVTRDLYLLSTLPSGSTTLDRIAAHGQIVTIKDHIHTSSVPDSLNHKEYGGRENKYGHDPTGTTVYYNADEYGVFVEDDQGNPIAMPPQVGLGHELVHAVHAGEGTHDPQPATIEPKVVGFPLDKKKVGSYGDKKGAGAPTENDLRRDLGLPLRANYGHSTPPDKRSPSLRPGGCC